MGLMQQMMLRWMKLKKKKRKKGDKGEKHLSGPEEMVPVFGKGNKDAIKWPHQAISSHKQKSERERKCKK